MELGITLTNRYPKDEYGNDELTSGIIVNLWVKIKITYKDDICLDVRKIRRNINETIWFSTSI